MKRLLVILSILFLPFSARAAIYNLGDCNQTTVNNKINDPGTIDGDTIVCPAGTWSWSDVNLNNKNITLKGYGTPAADFRGSTGNTIINITAGYGFEIPTANTKAFRVTNFRFRSAANFAQASGLIRIYGGHGWRFDHNDVEIYSTYNDYRGGYGLVMSRDVSGVVDHNHFVDVAGSPTCWHGAVLVLGDQTNAWSLPSQVGDDAHTVFIENNRIENTFPSPCTEPHGVFSYEGGIFVARYNDLVNVNIDAHGFEATIGTREYAIYENDWTIATGHAVNRLMYLRGGTGVVYNNRVTLEGTGFYNAAIRLTTPRVTENRGNPARPELYGGIPASVCASYEGYPSVDQIGRGQSIGTSPNKSQALDPLYLWNNPGNVAVVSYGGTSCTGNNSDYIQPNRDYYTTGAKPGYTAFEYPHPLTMAGFDTTPNQFIFTDIAGATLSTVYTSNTIIVSGIDAPATVMVTGGEYSKNGGAWTSAPGTAEVGNTFAVRLTSSGSYNTPASCTLTIGGVSDTYTVTTMVAPSVPRNKATKLKGTWR